MKSFIVSVDARWQVTIPVAIRKHLGVGRSGRIAFIVTDDGQVTLHSIRYTVQQLRGIVPALPGRTTTDFEDQIEEAMEAEADRIVDELRRS